MNNPQLRSIYILKEQTMTAPKKPVNKSPRKETTSEPIQTIEGGGGGDGDSNDNSGEPKSALGFRKKSN